MSLFPMPAIARLLGLVPVHGAEPPEAPVVLAPQLQDSLKAQRLAADAPADRNAGYTQVPREFELRQPVFWYGRKSWVIGVMYDGKIGEHLYDVLTERRENGLRIRARDLRQREGAWFGQPPKAVAA